MLFKHCYWSVFRLQYVKTRNWCQDGSLQTGFQKSAYSFLWSFKNISKAKARIGDLVNASVAVHTNLGLGWEGGCISIKAFFKQPIWSLKAWKLKCNSPRE